MDIYRFSENFWYLELGAEDTIEKAEQTKNRLIPLALGDWDYIKNSGKYSAETWDLESLGALPAKREFRRMKGEYILSQWDVSDNRVFPDTVVFGEGPLDDRYPAEYYHKGRLNTDIKTPAPYCIPYRTLYSANIDNLYFAGWNISMDPYGDKRYTCHGNLRASGTGSGYGYRDCCKKTKQHRIRCICII